MICKGILKGLNLDWKTRKPEITLQVEARPEGDIWFYRGPLSTILLSGRRFTALWPGDAHAPGIAVDRKPAPCRKCVVKVRVDWEG